MLPTTETSQGELTANDIKTLEQAGVIPKGTPNEQVFVFAAICKEKQLSPFSKEIYLVGYGGKYTPIVGINGFRKIAARTKELAGCSDAMFDLKADGSYKTSSEYKDGEKPITCSVTVWRMINGQKCAFTATVRFSEFTTNQQKWVSMPFQMIAKVAESHALRKGFGDLVTGFSLEEETGAIYDNVPKKELPTLDEKHELWAQVVEAVKNGKRNIEQLKERFFISPKIEEYLINAANSQTHE